MTHKLTEKQFLLICEKADEISDVQNKLIRPSHYSLTKKIETPLSPLISSHLSRAQQIIRAHSSENSKKALQQDLTYWQAWLSAVGFDFMREAINLGHLKAFVIQHAEGLPKSIDQLLVNQGFKQRIGPHKLSTIKRKIASLSTYLELENLPNPCRDFELRKLLEKLNKLLPGTQKKGKAITKDILLRIIDSCGDRLIDIRDKALLLFGWASGGRRRSEIALAQMENLELFGDCFIYRIPKSKTDQVGKGKAVPINGLAATALKEWLKSSKIENGFIFRSISKSGKIKKSISQADINRIVKLRCQKAGYNPNDYSAHSLRRGFITEAGRQRCPIGDVMELSGHKSLQVAMSYYQAGNISYNSASNLL